MNRDILAPKVESNLIEQAKEELGIKKSDFVIGAFNRMEKYSEPFLDLLCRLLDKDNRIKVIIAGPNEQKKVSMKLKKFIDSGRVLILGPVDVNIIGNCIDLGVDTFPLHSGYSVLELMAKNIPVISKKDESLGSQINDRFPETLKTEESELESLVIGMLNDPLLLESYKKKTDNFMKTHDKSNQFLKALDERVNILKRNKEQLI